MRHTNNFISDHGVSPTVGVILMVAITVILAATIGYVLTDLGGDNTQEQAQAGVSFNEQNNIVDVQLNSLDEDSIHHIYVDSDAGTYSGGLEHASDISYMSGPSNPDQYLYTENKSATNNTGGSGTTVSIDLTSVSSDGQIVVIGVTEGPNENIIQTYDY